jgi:Protein of unknown function (DUF3180)
VKPTRIVSLVALFAVVAALAWGALRLVEDRGGVLPPLSWSAPAGLLALAVVVLVTALGLRSRLRRGDKRPHPLSMVQMAVLGKASAHVGPIVGGLYGGYALVLLPSLDIGDRGHRALLAGGAVVASLALTAAGLLLERMCRVRGNGRDDDEPTATA